MNNVDRGRQTSCHIEAGSSDNIYAIDVETGRSRSWKKHFVSSSFTPPASNGPWRQHPRVRAALQQLL